MKERVILHSDMNSFYASVACRENPDLKRLPMVVGGNPKNRHGIVLAKNPQAKKAGIVTGEALWAAREKCPDLVVCPPDYPLYMKCSRQARKIYSEYTDRVEPFGPDEAWMDLTDCPCLHGRSPLDVADEIRCRMQEELGLTVSIGVSWNKIFAKFGSDYKKPNAVTAITRDNYREIVYPRPVRDLLCVGPATERKLKQIGVYTIGQMADLGPQTLRFLFGVNGEILWTFARGEDLSEVKPLNEETVGCDYDIRSIGNSLTAPRDLLSDREVKLLLYMLSESVGLRLREGGFRCGTVEIYVRDKALHGFTRQRKLETPTILTSVIAGQAYRLYEENYDMNEGNGIRSIGVRVSALTPESDPVQISFREDAKKAADEEKVEHLCDSLRMRYGNTMVRRAVTLGDEMSGLDFVRDHTVHPVGYFA